MKIIDERGKLFGRLNLIDFLVVLLIIAALAGVGLKVAGRGRGGFAPATKLTYTVKVSAVEPEVYQALIEHVPGQLMASGDMLDGWVVGVEAQPCESGGTLKLESGELSVTLQQGLLDLIFTIEANVVGIVTNEVGTQEVRIGKSHIVKTDKFELTGGILFCRPKDGKKECRRRGLPTPAAYTLFACGLKGVFNYFLLRCPRPA